MWRSEVTTVPSPNLYFQLPHIKYWLILLVPLLPIASHEVMVDPFGSVPILPKSVWNKRTVSSLSTFSLFTASHLLDSI